MKSNQQFGKVGNQHEDSFSNAGSCFIRASADKTHDPAAFITRLQLWFQIPSSSTESSLTNYAFTNSNIHLPEDMECLVISARKTIFLKILFQLMPMW